MDRRKFLLNSGLVAGVTAIAPGCAKSEPAEAPVSFKTWEDIRAQFPLAKERTHMAQMFLASHPKPVSDEIARHRKNFDEDPVNYFEANFQTAEGIVCKAAGKYMDTDPEEIALTDSTTMGLSILYNGLQLKPGDEILTSVHDHYATEKALEFAARKRGAVIRRLTLYDDPSQASIDAIVSTIGKAIQPQTKVVALTWVHSVSGVKIPIAEIGKVVKKANETRPPEKRIYFCVDGVHGFGVDISTVKDLGCDFFAAGCHKWIFGPRGTGVLYGKRDAWDFIAPTIPAFSPQGYGQWMGAVPEAPISFSELHSPGGFHSFENRWSLNAGFEFQMNMGKERSIARTKELSARLKEGLLSIKHVKLHTPVDAELSAGINCFDVEGMTADEVVKTLADKHKIIGSAAPYRKTSARLTPSIVNSESEVDAAIRAIETIKG